MAIHRTNPKCPNCGGEIKGKYFKPKTPFAGDTFIEWDWEGHTCKVGIKYFIERTDNNRWWSSNGWTNDTQKAMVFDSSEEAEEYLKESTEISARIACAVTEHEFVKI